MNPGSSKAAVEVGSSPRFDAQPSSPNDFTSAQEPGQKTWASVLQNFSPGADAAGVVFDYCPLPVGSSVISPPDEVLRKGIEKFRFCIVGTFTKGTIPFHKVSECAKKSWESRGLCDISQKNNSQYLFKFTSEACMNAILARGTWYFERKPMIVCPWGSASKSDSVKSIPLWLKLSNLPDYYWTREGLSFLASAVGKPLCADHLTEKLNPLPFAQMSEKLIVSPIVKTLVFSKVPEKVKDWIEEIAREWRFKRIIPAHFSAPINASRSEFLAAFAFLDDLLHDRYVTRPSHSLLFASLMGKAASYFPPDDMKTLSSLDGFLVSVGAVKKTVSGRKRR